ncbi:hypothetical protein HPP92_021337 [Vanilla planifolia]|uniref:Uncharacterized protein n=1 Tax=Vanilla planifolia TaxID=51239 RepID=A0A835PYN1_VANPL|nr:hypothetical protein HPP92_021337 [Vanilla planifolia]
MWIPASLAYPPPRSSEAPPVANLHQHEGVEGVMRGFKRCDRADLKQTVGVPAGDRSFSAGVGKREARNSKGSGWEVLDLELNGLTRFTMKPNIKIIESCLFLISSSFTFSCSARWGAQAHQHPIIAPDN